MDINKLSLNNASECNPEKTEISKRELETVFDAIDEMICIIDNNYRILRANKGYVNSVGKEMKDILGAHCYDVFWGCQKCTGCPSQQTFLTKETVIRKQIIKRAPDDIRYFEIKTFPIMDDTTTVVHVIEFIKDVTEEKRMTEQLIRSEKLASIGIMTAGIAHEMNNPLSGISGNAVNLLEMSEKYGLNDKGISRINAILESAARATLIMKDLLHLSKKNDVARILVDLNKLIVKTINAVHLPGISEIKKRFSFDETIPFIMCDPSKIDQVILNITTNAVQSILEKKQILVSQGKQYEGKLLISTLHQKNSILITITDNGIGIAPEIRSKIFDPFFSTKPTGQGTGLGLSICHRIIEEHRGRIFFECIDDSTIFSIELPIDSKPIWA